MPRTVERLLSAVLLPITAIAVAVGLPLALLWRLVEVLAAGAAHVVAVVAFVITSLRDLLVGEIRLRLRGRGIRLKS